MLVVKVVQAARHATDRDKFTVHLCRIIRHFGDFFEVGARAIVMDSILCISMFDFNFHKPHYRCGRQSDHRPSVRQRKPRPCADSPMDY